eukprot:4140591-Prymnesium_polylepis.1
MCLLPEAAVCRQHRRATERRMAGSAMSRAHNAPSRRMFSAWLVGEQRVNGRVTNYSRLHAFPVHTTYYRTGKFRNSEIFIDTTGTQDG